MKQRVLSVAGGFVSVAAALLAVPTTASADATLDYTVSSTCTLTTPGGSTNVPCDSTLWTVTLQPGWSATLSATWNWHYVDDGLPVERGELIATSGFGGTRPTFVESAGIYVQTLPVCGRAGCPSIPPALSGDMFSGAVFESENAIPDDIAGSRTLTLTASWSAEYPEGYHWTGQMGFFPLGTFVNAVPEPSTYALFGVSLVALAAVRRRRQPRA